MKIILGTRGSSLALAQAQLARAALSQLPGIEEIRVEVVKTTGDRRLDLRLSDSGKKFEKGLFTKELEEALLSGRIDIAVHSLKDLPIELPMELTIGAVLPREDPADVLVSRQASSLDAVRKGGMIATSSPRRARQLQRLRPDLQIVDLRGNVPTRLQKLIDYSDWDGVVLALAGLKRLNLEMQKGCLQFGDRELRVSVLEAVIPAAGQGAIALEVLAKSNCDLLQPVNDASTWFCVQAEREFLRLLGGGCEVPIGVRARPGSPATVEPTVGTLSCASGDRQEPVSTVSLEAIIFDENGLVRTGSINGSFSSPGAAANALFQEIHVNPR